LFSNRSEHSRRSAQNAICQATGLDFNAELKLVYQAGRATSCSDRSWEEGPSHVTGREGGGLLLVLTANILKIYVIYIFVTLLYGK